MRRPIVSIPGGEPLLYPHIGELVKELTRRRKYVYLCTNALLLREKLEQNVFTPSKRLSFSVHMDGLREEHDASVCRDGVYDIAVDAIREAVRRGFRVTTNTTLFNTSEPMRVRDFFDAMMDLDVEGMMVSPGYSYEKAPDQESFLERERTQELFSEALTGRKKRWRFNQSPLFLQFLMGKRDFECTPWGNPLYTIFGWQRPCYLLQDGYAATFRELMDETPWDEYGAEQRQSALPGLHGALRVRTHRRPRDVHHVARSARLRRRHAHRQAVSHVRARDSDRCCTAGRR